MRLLQVPSPELIKSDPGCGGEEEEEERHVNGIEEVGTDTDGQALIII